MRRVRSAGKAVVGVGLLLVIAVAIVLLVKGLYPAELPANRSPDFVDTIFDNRGVLWTARLLLVSAGVVLAFGGVFIVLSIGIRIRNGEWLRRAGPFEISGGTVGKAEEEIDFWRQAARANQKEAVTLRQSLRESEELIQDLR